MWLYKGKILSKLEDFGEPTPFGFVYIITHLPSEKSYIGKKVLFFNQRKNLTKKELAEVKGPGRKPKTKIIIKESDWLSYFSSNKKLIELSKKEPNENFRREILVLTPNKKLLTYYETKLLFQNEVLEFPEKWFNDNISGHFFTKDIL